MKKDMWCIDKRTLKIAGPFDRKYIDREVVDTDFYTVVIRDQYDVKAQFCEEDKNALLHKFKRRLKANEDINEVIFGLVTGKKPVSPTKRTASHRAALVSLGSMYREASKVLGEAEGSLQERYGHLNPGLQSMNLRNRINKKLKERGDGR